LSPSTVTTKAAKPPQPRLIVISAPSGAGKTTLCAMLLKEYPHIALSISATTREKRPNEIEGKHYFFVSNEAFEQKKQAGEFVEWAEVHGNFYGSPKAYVDSTLAEGKHLLFDIDIQGAKSFREQYGERALLIFILPPSVKALEKRLVERKEDSQQAIEKRLQNAYNELEWSKFFQYQIRNDQLDKAYQQLRTIINKECQ